MLVAGTVNHRPADFDDDAPGRRWSSVVSNHNPAAAARHWHAIIRFLQDEPCWACRWHRALGLPVAAPTSLPDFVHHPLGLLPPRSAATIARFTRLSRGPPAPPRPVEI
jgi:hypothetical protein